MSTVIAILTRSPADPRLKARLADVLPTGTGRRELALAFLDDEIAGCRTLDVAVRIAVTPPLEGMRMSRPGLGGSLILAQRGMASAERQLHVLEDLARAGFANVIMMGADLPDLPEHVLRDAVTTLESNPEAVVMRPAMDGGYYLLGLAVKPGPIPDLFAKLRWSTPEEADDLALAVAEAARTLVRLDQWRDVDTPDDLVALVDRLRSAPGTAPKTYEALARLGFFSR
jgi:glycosyltransferase A (GT-A) superfamily protein (DUF2064 family)